jgi:glycosyltransferase involved in cell wall biosynthesis
MAESPEITVVIPVYNRRPLLTEAVRSVLDQSYGGFECIIVDDGSTDETWDMPAARNSFGGDPRVKVHRIEHTGMPGLVRNRGAALSSSPHLAFLDSDDVWMSDKLQRQVRFFRENPRIRICPTREKWIRAGREVSQARQRHLREGMIFQDSLKKCIIGPSTVMMERSLFEETGGFREDLEIAEDYELWLRITSRVEVGYIDEPLVTKRAGHGDQLSRKYGHIEYYRIQGLMGLVDEGSFPPELDALARRELSRKCGIYASGCRKRGRVGEAEKFEALARKYGKL